jgi:proteasome lid subunit RPN8/RPN11
MSQQKDRDSKNEKDAARAGVRESASGGKPVRRTFPGPRGAAEILRVAVERSAYAELVAHAKGSLDAEVCGVLAGHVCEDDEGMFVDIEAVIRGSAASQGSTHVTFTQATWNEIYKILERDYPKLKIVGWYHTHPGFGVEFSEMDLFIQRNFFAGPSQIALVTDPLNGDVAICTNTPQGIEYLGRFWVDGREQQCRAPQRGAETAANDQPANSAASAAPGSAQALETRVSQLLQSLDELRRFHYRFMLSCGILFSLAIVLTVGYIIYSSWSSRVEPPKVNQIVPIPVQVGDKTVILGVAITSWEVPPELNSIMLQMESLKREAAEKAAKAEAEKSRKTTSVAATATNAPSAVTTNIPPAAAAPK